MTKDWMPRHQRAAMLRDATRARGWEIMKTDGGKGPNANRLRVLSVRLKRLDAIYDACEPMSLPIVEKETVTVGRYQPAWNGHGAYAGD